MNSIEFTQYDKRNELYLFVKFVSNFFGNKKRILYQLCGSAPQVVYQLQQSSSDTLCYSLYIVFLLGNLDAHIETITYLKAKR